MLWRSALQLASEPTIDSAVALLPQSDHLTRCCLFWPRTYLDAQGDCRSSDRQRYVDAQGSRCQFQRRKPPLERAVLALAPSLDILSLYTAHVTRSAQDAHDARASDTGLPF